MFSDKKNTQNKSIVQYFLQNKPKLNTEFPTKNNTLYKKYIYKNHWGTIQALMAQQKKQIDEAIEAAQNTQLEKNAEEQNISLKEFDGILQPIIDSCTKDSISQGKYNKKLF